MTVRPELFRAKATECKVAAHRAQAPEIKEAYLDLMRGWRELAEQVERIEHSWLDRYGF